MTRDEMIKLISNSIPSQRMANVNLTHLDLVHQILDVLESSQQDMKEGDFANLIGVCASLTRMEFSEMDAGFSAIDTIQNAKNR